MTTQLLRGSFRFQFFLGFLACAGLLAYAIYLQLHDGLEPCNLCIFQRISRQRPSGTGPAAASSS